MSIENPLYQMSESSSALYAQGWTGPNLQAELDKPQSEVERLGDWTTQLKRKYALAQAASRDMIDHDGSDWPNHPAYTNAQAYGLAFAQTWTEYEPRVRHRLGAGPAESYKDAKGHYDASADPANKAKAPSIIPALVEPDIMQIGGLTVINRTGATSDPQEIIDAFANASTAHLPEMPSGAFGARVMLIDDVRPHGENLSIVTVGGHEVVANRKEDGSFRWTKGEACVYVPEGALIPEDVLQERGYWDAAKGKGMLEGKKGNRVKMRRFAGHESRGLLFKVGLPETPWFGDEKHPEDKAFWLDRGDRNHFVNIGDDVTDFFGITEHKAG